MLIMGFILAIFQALMALLVLFRSNSDLLPWNGSFGTVVQISSFRGCVDGASLTFYENYKDDSARSAKLT